MRFRNKTHEVVHPGYHLEADLPTAVGHIVVLHRPERRQGHSTGGIPSERMYPHPRKEAPQLFVEARLLVARMQLVVEEEHEVEVGPRSGREMHDPRDLLL